MGEDDLGTVAGPRAGDVIPAATSEPPVPRSVFVDCEDVGTGGEVSGVEHGFTIRGESARNLQVRSCKQASTVSAINSIV
jgi:hypothetical protein